MMRRIRVLPGDFAGAARAPGFASCALAVPRLLPLYLTFANGFPWPCHLLGPKRTLRAQYDKFGASF